MEAERLREKSGRKKIYPKVERKWAARAIAQAPRRPTRELDSRRRQE